MSLLRTSSSGLRDSTMKNDIFEEFEKVVDNQKERVLQIDQNVELEQNKKNIEQEGGGSNVAARQLTNEEREKLYIEVLYTIRHKLREDEHARLMLKASEEKPPQLVLNVEIKEARDLMAKDANGFSDPYCMLGIVPDEGFLSDGDSVRHFCKPPGGQVFSGSSGSTSSVSEEREALSRYSASFRKKVRDPRKPLPVKLIQTTRVVSDTCSPVWNEGFKLEVDDITMDIFHLDVWDHDDDQSVFDAARKLNEVSGFRGLKRYFKQIAQSARSSAGENVDDYLGGIDVRLQDIPSTGLNKWLPLKPRQEQFDVTGEISLALTLGTRDHHFISDDDNWNELLQHEDLLRILVLHEIRVFDGPSSSWDGILSRSSETILHQHALQGDLSMLQLAICQWLVYFDVHRQQVLNYELLTNCINKLDEVYSTNLASEDLLREEEREKLATSFGNYTNFCLTLISRIHDLFPPANRQVGIKLSRILVSLATLHNSSIYRRCIPFPAASLKSLLSKALVEAADHWYRTSRAIVLPKVSDDAQELVGLLDMIQHFTANLRRAERSYQPNFQQLFDISYIYLTYKSLAVKINELISDTVEPYRSKDGRRKLMDLSSEHARSLTGNLFAVYLALNEFNYFKCYIDDSEIKNMAKDKCSLLWMHHQLFLPVVERWLALANVRIIQRIPETIEKDDGEPNTEGGMMGTSGVDCGFLIFQLIDFWKKLNWKTIGAYSFVLRITEDACAAAELYARSVHGKLASVGFYDMEGQFDISQKLCTMINNIEYVRTRCIEKLPEELDYETVIYDAVRSTGDEQSYEIQAEKFRRTLYEYLNSAQEQLMLQIKRVVEHSAGRMQSDIKRFVFSFLRAPEADSAGDALQPLLDYLNENLLTSHQYLYKSNFDQLLLAVWTQVAFELRNNLTNSETLLAALASFSSVESYSEYNWFFERIDAALEALRMFFNAGGGGLSDEQFRTQMLEDCENFIKLHRESSNYLAGRFCRHLCHLQAEMAGAVAPQFGRLNVKVLYDRASRRLHVTVLSASDLIPLDTNGTSDPYVVIEFWPPAQYPEDFQGRKTNYISKTLSPQFNQSFNYDKVDPVTYASNHSCLVFSVFDKDRIVSDDLEGVAFLMTSSIPGLDRTDSTNSPPSPKTFTLALIKPAPQVELNTILTVLETRPYDKAAVDFISRWKQLVDRAKESMH